MGSATLSHVDEPSNHRGTGGRFRPTPALPKQLVDAWPPVIIGTVVWSLVFVVLLSVGAGDVWRWTALAGAGLGVIGMGIMWWQRAASRRGKRGAHRGL